MKNYIKKIALQKSINTPLYALCDFETLSKKAISLEKFIELLKNHNVKLLQYRDKKNSIEIQKKHLEVLKKALDIPIIINDNMELLEVANGLHLGQEDIQKLMKNRLRLKSKEALFEFLQKKYPNKIFGISTHNELEILQANDLNIEYIGLGAYKATSTKDVTTILGEKISYLAKISKHPVCAIGGVKIEDKLENVSFNVVGSDLYSD